MAMGEEPERPETRGIALAALGLAIGIVSRLQVKGVLNPADIEYVVGGALSTFEDFLPPGDPATRAARELLEAVHALAVARDHKPTTG